MNTTINKVKVLEEIEHIRIRKNMYIGSSETPDHLITEVLDNSLDELINNFADEVGVTISDNNEVEIYDNGRSIPIHDIELDNKKIDSIIAIATKLFSGTKFDDNNYDIKIGQNGVGLVVVNALSDYLYIDIKNNKKYYRYSFKDSIFLDKKEIIPDKNISTRIIFKPSDKYFETCKFNSDIILKRLQLVKSHINKIKLFFQNKLVEEIDFISYIRTHMEIDEKFPLYIVESNDKINKIQMKMAFGYDLDSSSTIYKAEGSVNLRSAEGTYLTNALNATASSAIETIPKNFIINKSDVLYKIRVYISMLIPEPTFDSQNKIRLLTKVQNSINLLIPEITKIYKSNENLQKILTEINNNKILKTVKLTTNTKSKKSVDNPIIDCKKKPGKRLFILEGASAAGPLKRIRDLNTEAVFPIMGKVLNVLKQPLNKIIANASIKYLFEVLNYDVKTKVENIPYENIILFADADPDGSHINALLVLFFSKFFPETIKQGRLKILFAPLFAIKKANKYILSYEKQPPQNEKFTRFKGLGEMNDDQLKAVIDDGHYYQIKYPDNINEIYNIFLDTELKKKLLEKGEK